MSRSVAYLDELHVSPRVTLRAGDVFRATGGPYYRHRNEAGQWVKTAMHERGPFVFHRLAQLGRRAWIEAFACKTRQCVVLPITARRATVPGLVPRPYRVTGKVRERSISNGSRGKCPR